MSSEDFVIKILVQAQSQIAPIMATAAAEANRLQETFKKLERSTADLKRRTDQLEGGVAKAAVTMRALNPTLDSMERKFKTLSLSMTNTNRSMGVLERNSAKAAGALGTLGGIVERLEKKLEQLDRKMTEMGARKYEPKIEAAGVAKTQAQVDALLKQLLQLERKKRDVRIGAETAIFDREIDRVEKKLVKLGATKLVAELRAALNTQDEALLKEKLKNLEEKARDVARERDIKFILKGEEYVKAEIRSLNRNLEELASKDVGPGVYLNRRRFRADYAATLAELAVLGATGVEVNVKAKIDRSNFDRFAEEFTSQLDKLSEFGDIRYTGLINQALRLALIFSEPLLSALTGVIGALVAVGAAAGQAAIGLAGLATAGAAQAIPVLGLLAFAFSRFAAVMKVAQLGQAERDKGGAQSAAIDNAKANALDGLRRAHQGVVNAQRNLILAQERLNEARREGIRTITDLMLAEQRSALAATQSRLAFATQIATGRGGGLLEAAQLDTRVAGIEANRARAGAARAQTGGVEGLPAVETARRGVEDAKRALDEATRSVVRAQRELDQAGSKLGAAASAYETALKKLSAGERVLLESFEKTRKMFTDKDSDIRKISDTIVRSFAFALDRLRVLLRDPTVLKAFQQLADSLAGAIRSIASFMTGPTMRKALSFFAGEASKNVGTFASILKSLISIFASVATAASGPFKTALQAVDTFFKSMADKAADPKGREGMRKFFEDALKPMAAFLKLGGALFELFLALVGAGAADEGTKGIDRLTATINKATEWVKKHGKEVRKFFADAVDAASDVLRVIVGIARSLIRTFDKKSVKDFADFIIKVVLPVFEGLVKIIGFVVRALLDVANSPVGSFLIQLLGYFIGLKVIVGVLAGLFSGLGTIIKILGFAFRALLLSNPLGWVVLGVSAVIALLAKLGVLDDVIRALGSAVKWVANAFGDAWDWIKTATGNAVSWIGNAAGDIADFFSGLWEGVLKGVKGFFSDFKDTITGAFDTVIDAFKAIGDAIIDVFKKAFEKVGEWVHKISQVPGIKQALAVAEKIFGSPDHKPPAETAAPAGPTGPVTGTLDKAQDVGQRFGLHITSGYRSPARNRAAGGVEGSLHTHGTPANPGAIDLVGPVAQMYSALAWARTHLKLKESLVHDVGSGLHLHLGFFAKGGEIAGAMGQPVPIVAHAGEWVVNRGQQSRIAQAVGTSVGGLRSMLGFHGGPRSFQGGGEVGRLPASRQGATVINRLIDSLGNLVGLAPVEGFERIIASARATLARMAARGKSKILGIARGLDVITSDGGPLAALDAAITERAAQATRKIQTRRFRVSSAGTATRVDLDPIAQGQAEVAILAQARAGYEKELTEVGKLLVRARRALANAHSPKQRELLRGVINRLLVRQEAVNASLATNAQGIVEAQEAAQTQALAATNQNFDRIRAGISRFQRIVQAFGARGFSVAIIDKQIKAAQDQIGDLTKIMEKAKATGNTTLAAQIKDQIEELSTSIYEMTANRIQVAVDEINSSAAFKLGINDIKQRLATLGVSLEQARSGQFNVAQLGRTNYAGMGAALQERGDILQDQRSALLGQFATAQAQGNLKAMEDLSIQIGSLDIATVENTKAIHDNTTAQAADTFSRSQTRSDFLVGLGNSAIQIAESLGLPTKGLRGALGGTLAQQGTEYRGQLEGFAPQFFGGIGGLHGPQLATALATGYQQAEASGMFSDSDLALIRDWATAIIGNEQATIENTKALGENTDSNQTWSTTAWQMYRLPIFTGSNTLLPQYAPSLQTGGLITKSGMFNLHAGEVVQPADQRSWGGDTSVKVDIHEAAHGVDYLGIGNAIAFQLKQATAV